MGQAETIGAWRGRGPLLNPCKYGFRRMPGSYEQIEQVRESGKPQVVRDEETGRVLVL